MIFSAGLFDFIKIY